MNKNQVSSSCQINDRNYREAFEARNKRFAPVPNHPARRAGPRVFYMENTKFLIQFMKTVYAKSNTVDKNKKTEANCKN